MADETADQMVDRLVPMTAAMTDRLQVVWRAASSDNMWASPMVVQTAGCSAGMMAVN